MTRRSHRLALAVLLLSAASLPAADEVKPRWRFEKGQTLRYLLKHHEQRKVTVNVEDFETKTDVDFHWEWTVKEVDDKGVATLDAKLTGLRFEVRGRGYEFDYDSNGTNSSDDQFKKDMIAYLDDVRKAAYRLRLAPDGAVKEVRGFDSALADAPPANRVHDTNGLTLRDAAFGWYLQQALGVLPDAAVAEGGRWKRPTKTKLGSLGELSGETEYHLAKAAKAGGAKEHELRFAGARSLDLDMKWGDGSLRGPFTIAKVKGVVHFDPKTHAVARSEYKTEMSGDLKLNDSAEPVLKVELKQTVSLEARP